ARRQPAQHAGTQAQPFVNQPTHRPRWSRKTETLDQSLVHERVHRSTDQGAHRPRKPGGEHIYCALANALVAGLVAELVAFVVDVVALELLVALWQVFDVHPPPYFAPVVEHGEPFVLA